MTVEELKKKIVELIGITPTSNDRAYLAARLAELRKKGSLSISISEAAKHAANELAEATDKNVSALVHDALVEYAKSHGHITLALRLEKA